VTVVIIEPRRDRKKRETRDRIVSVALDLFTRRGIDACTIDDIAARADIGKGTIYNYFRTKEDIIIAFMVDVERGLQDKLAAQTPRRGSAASVLTKYIEFHFKLKEQHHAFVRVLLAQMCGKAGSGAAWIQEVQAFIDPPLIDIFTDLRRRGVLRPDLQMPAVVQAFKVMHLGLTILWALEGPPWRYIGMAVENQVRLFCSGIEVNE
jgi:AcrR family transcriptional regulator